MVSCLSSRVRILLNTVSWVRTRAMKCRFPFHCFTALRVSLPLRCAQSLQAPAAFFPAPCVSAPAVCAPASTTHALKASSRLSSASRCPRARVPGVPGPGSLDLAGEAPGWNRPFSCSQTLPRGVAPHFRREQEPGALASRARPQVCVTLSPSPPRLL